MPSFGSKHIELCRKDVVPNKNESMCINLNKNLYKKVHGIYSKGNEFDEDTYIHVKYRDLRIEMPESEFVEFADMVVEARNKLRGKNG